MADKNIREKIIHADSVLREGRPCEAEALFNELFKNYPDLADHEKGLILSGRGVAHYQQGNLDSALQDLQHAGELLSVTYGTTSISTARTLVFLASVRVSQGNVSDGCALGHEALEILNQTVEENDPILAEACFLLSQAEFLLNNLDSAESLTHRALHIWEKHLGSVGVGISSCLNNLGRIYDERGQIDKGIAYHRRSLDMRRELLGNHIETAFSMGNLGTSLAIDGQWREAAELLQECLDCYASFGITDGPMVELHRRNLAVCHQALVDNGKEISYDQIQAP